MGNLPIKYVVVEDDGFHAQAWLDGMRIGCVLCERDDDRLQICDIRVEEQAPPRQQTIGRRLRTFIFRPPKQLRRRGVGTELLSMALSHADTTGVREVWGCVMRHDLDAWPGLLEWYERQGFVVHEPDPECLHGAAKKIVRRRAIAV